MKHIWITDPDFLLTLLAVRGIQAGDSIQYMDLRDDRVHTLPELDRNTAQLATSVFGRPSTPFTILKFTGWKPPKEGKHG